MTDLANKFANFQEQAATQHTEIMAALDAIAYALGVPPSTPTTTLEDVVTAITTTNSLLSTTNTLLTGIRTDMNSYLLDIFNTLDTINTNASLNTQRLLIAIAANDPCRDCATTPIAPPPLDVTPQTVDQEHCKRMQALIYALRRFTVKLDLLSSFGLGFSPTVINDAITEIMTELGVSELLEFPSLGEVAQLAGAGAAYIVSNIFSSTSLPAEFLSIEDALLPVLYAADNAADGQAAYRALLAGSSLDHNVQLLFSAMAYTSIFNLYYDSTIELDVSGYDGNICDPEPEGCTTLISASYSGENQVFVNETFTGYDYYHVLVTATSGNFNSGIWLNEEFQVGPYGDYEAYFETNLSFRYQGSSFFPGTGTVLVEGCYGETPEL